MTAERAPIRPAFASAESEAAFFAAYDAVLSRWPVDVAPVDIATAYGLTHVQVCGPEQGPPLVLLHGGGATSTVWFANIAALSRTHRVYAVDQIGDAGRSVHDGPPLRAAKDLMIWMDSVLDLLGLDGVALCGHSYGAWLGLRYALHAPERVRRLVLLDPTDCFAGLHLRYRLHAVPLFIRPSTRRMRDFLAWETAGASLDPAWLQLVALAGGEVQGSKVVLPRRPDTERLRAARVPTLLLLAGQSKAHDIRRVSANAHRLLRDVATETLPNSTHHTLPMLDSATIDEEILRFTS